MEKLRSQFGRYPFRCHACGHRFFETIQRRSKQVELRLLQSQAISVRVRSA